MISNCVEYNIIRPNCIFQLNIQLLPSFVYIMDFYIQPHYRVFNYFCNQAKRITAANALMHMYLEEGRLRYHTCMCTCCSSTLTGGIKYTDNSEPDCSTPFHYNFEDELTSVTKIRGRQLDDC